MYKVTIVSERKTTDVRFFVMDEDMIDYINETFVETGKIVGKKLELSEDGLTQTETIMFDSEESFIAFMSDEILKYNRKRLRRFNDYHRIAHSINANDISMSKKLYSIYTH